MYRESHFSHLMGKTVPQARSSDAEGTITIMMEVCNAYSQKRV